MQGISFLDTIYSIFLQRQFDQDYIDSEMHHWLDLLFQLVDITVKDPDQDLHLFLLQHKVRVEYRPYIKKKVCVYG